MDLTNNTYLFLISNFRRVLNIVCILLGISPASDCCLPTFRNPLSVPSPRAGCRGLDPAPEDELIEGSETSANNRTPGKYPKEYIQYLFNFLLFCFKIYNLLNSCFFFYYLKCYFAAAGWPQQCPPHLKVPPPRCSNAITSMQGLTPTQQLPIGTEALYLEAVSSIHNSRTRRVAQFLLMLE